MSAWVCLDASVALKLVLPEQDSLKATALWQSIQVDKREPVAPYLFFFEITGVLRKNVRRGLITADYGLLALQSLLKLNITLVTPKELHIHAWHIATQFDWPTAYDAHYLALAAHLDCDFWTADERLYQTTHQQFTWVKRIGDYTG